MKIAMINHSDLSGGAALGSYRLFEALSYKGHDVSLYVGLKISSRDDVYGLNNSHLAISRFLKKLNHIPIKFQSWRNNRDIPEFNVHIIPVSLIDFDAINQADIVYIHWIAGVFLNINDLKKIKKPIIWKFADLWAATGGCHYTHGCDGFTGECGKCPQLMSNTTRDISHSQWTKKYKSFKNIDITVVTPSRWLSIETGKSKIFSDKKIVHISNGIDTDRYTNRDKKQSRMALGLDPDKKYLLIGAENYSGNPRKGYVYAVKVLSELALSCSTKFELMIVGGNGSALHTRELEDIKKTDFGRIADHNTLNDIYSAADLFICTSIEENFSNMILESLACGTPVSAFNTGGNPEMIEHGQNGCLAENMNAEEMASQIKSFLNSHDKHVAMSNNARMKVTSEFTYQKFVEKYIELMEQTSKRQGIIDAA